MCLSGVACDVDVDRHKAPLAARSPWTRYLAHGYAAESVDWQEVRRGGEPRAAVGRLGESDRRRGQVNKRGYPVYAAQERRLQRLEAERLENEAVLVRRAPWPSPATTRAGRRARSWGPS